MDDLAAETEQDAIRRFLALREGLRSQGLTAEVEAIKDWLPRVRDQRMAGEMAKLLGFYWLRRGRYVEAIEFSERAAVNLPLDADVAYNVIFALFQTQRWDDVVARAKQALEVHPNNFEFCNILSATLGALDRLDEAHEYGTRSLRLKDAVARGPAVDEWLQSNRHFHLMRDHYDHSELVLAGMWGGVRGAPPSLVPAIRDWLANSRQVPGKTTDQVFLRECLWPTVRQSVLAHDSQFAFGETRDFPSVGRLPPGFWVGCDGRRMLAR